MNEQTFQWMMGLGLAGIGAMMLYLHSQTMKILGDRIDKLTERIDKLDEKLTDVDRRLCRIEGAMSTCCVLNHSHEQQKKVE